MSRNFPECAETFQRVCNFFKVPKTFQGVQKLSRVSAIFQKKLQLAITFLYFTTQKHSRLQKLSIKRCLNAWEVFLTLPIIYKDILILKPGCKVYQIPATLPGRPPEGEGRSEGPSLHQTSWLLIGVFTPSPSPCYLSYHSIGQQLILGL